MCVELLRRAPYKNIYQDSRDFVVVWGLLFVTYFGILYWQSFSHLCQALPLLGKVTALLLKLVQSSRLYLGVTTEDAKMDLRSAHSNPHAPCERSAIYIPLAPYDDRVSAQSPKGRGDLRVQTKP